MIRYRLEGGKAYRLRYIIAQGRSSLALNSLCDSGIRKSVLLGEAFDLYMFYLEATHSLPKYCFPNCYSAPTELGFEVRASKDPGRGISSYF